jgi:hypothetical protein
MELSSGGKRRKRRRVDDVQWSCERRKTLKNDLEAPRQEAKSTKTALNENSGEANVEFIFFGSSTVFI